VKPIIDSACCWNVTSLSLVNKPKTIAWLFWPVTVVVYFPSLSHAMPPSTGEQHSDDRSAQPEAGERRAQRSIESKLVAGRSGRDLGHGHRRRQSRDQAVRRRAMALQPPPSVHAVTIPFADLRVTNLRRRRRDIANSAAFHLSLEFGAVCERL